LPVEVIKEVPKSRIDVARRRRGRRRRRRKRRRKRRWKGESGGWARKGRRRGEVGRGARSNRRATSHLKGFRHRDQHDVDQVVAPSGLPKEICLLSLSQNLCNLFLDLAHTGSHVGSLKDVGARKEITKVQPPVIALSARDLERKPVAYGDYREMCSFQDPLQV